jgi:copper homeostasis protein
MVLEICVDSLDSARAAERGGAQRIELCSDLMEGGVTPSSGLISAVREALTIPVFVIIRPRGGDFYYTAEEFGVMKRDVAAAKSYGAGGVVVGALTQNGQVDVERTQELVELARPMGVTFHRAIDRAEQIDEALEAVIRTGADRVLTSGGRQTAEQGVENISRLVTNAAGRIGVMVCGTIRKENIGQIARKTNASEFHASLRKKMKSPVSHQNSALSLGEVGLDEFARYAVTAEDVRALREALLAAQEDSFQKA